jgi:hypothetical protein
MADVTKIKMKDEFSPLTWCLVHVKVVDVLRKYEDNKATGG